MAGTRRLKRETRGLEIDWDAAVDKDELKRRLSSGRYSLKDVLVSKAFTGNERILLELLRLSSGRSDVEQREALDEGLARAAWNRRRREK